VRCGSRPKSRLKNIPLRPRSAGRREETIVINGAVHRTSKRNATILRRAYGEAIANTAQGLGRQRCDRCSDGERGGRAKTRTAHASGRRARQRRWKSGSPHGDQRRDQARSSCPNRRKAICRARPARTHSLLLAGAWRRLDRSNPTLLRAGGDLPTSYGGFAEGLAENVPTSHIQRDLTDRQGAHTLNTRCHCTQGKVGYYGSVRLYYATYSRVACRESRVKP
jgi:hypothetical protein